MIYVRIFLIALWLMLCCVVGLLACLILWGNDNLDHYFGRLFAWGATRLAGLRMELSGLENLEAHQPCIYVSNHQSAMDMATFGTIYPRRTVLIGKKELNYIPLFGLFFKAAGNITINRSKRVSAMASLAGAVDQIRDRKVSVWIFPEGTRNDTDDPMLPFKKGAFHMAIQAQVPVVPILCSPLGEVMSWQNKAMPGGSVRVKILQPIPTTGMTAKDSDSLSAIVRERMLTAIAEISRPAQPPGG